MGAAFRRNIRILVLGFTGVIVFATGCHHKPRVDSKPRAALTPRPVGPPVVQQRPTPAPAPRPNVPPNWIPPGGVSGRWTTIVVHHSATSSGSARSFDRAHRDKGWDELGYHFVIGNGTSTGDGVVEVGSRWYSQKHGAHCKTPDNYFNEHGIGICLVGDFTKTRPTQRQMQSLERLVAFLCEQCHIPESRVTTHGLVTHKTQCPGRNFPLVTLRRALAMNEQRRPYAQ